MAAQEPYRLQRTTGCFTGGMPDVALVDVHLCRLRKVEVFGTGETDVDNELDGPVATISAPTIHSSVVDILTGDVP